MKSIGPFTQTDFGGFDRPRALFSKMPVNAASDLDYVFFMDDFTQTVVDATNEWIVVTDSAGGETTILDPDAENGVMKLTSKGTTDDNGSSIQRANTIFLVKSGKKLWFEAKVKLSDADQGDLFVGLANNFATDPEAVWAATLERVGFMIQDGSANIMYSVNDGTVDTIVDTGKDAADDTFVKLGFRTDGGSIRFYVDRSLVATVAIPSAIAAVTLGPAFAGISGSASGTHTRSIDYIMACQER